MVQAVKHNGIRYNMLMGRPVKILICALVVLPALILAGSCASLPFHPSPDLAGTPANLSLEFSDVLLKTSDHETISGWFIPAKQQEFVLLFLHGNAGNISHRLTSIEIFHQLGLAVLIIDYRGFGGSSGSPSVNGTLLDARAAWDWLVTEKGVDPQHIIIFGRSLGGGVAAALAAQVEPRALILESTFTCLYDVAKDIYPWLPVSWFLPQDYNTPANAATQSSRY